MKNDRKRVKNVDGKDRLSDLHDDILIHIQSFLDVKSAAQTCVLSRRWNNKLWIHHPDVYLNSKTFVKAVIKFRKFADRVLNRKTLVKALLKFQTFVDMVLAQRNKLHLKTRTGTIVAPMANMVIGEASASVTNDGVME
ncbi:hypothetical protein POM88_052839 [Heracleum sosnowskyi]|uniref:F-box domain-containing protein n=1 Tax=Heracleum sosnowskyi TaxID=360622 RepID=A0AAD8GQY4_9APIA|nr:hypothetical protein POM88_052839 [Heracleum sosnowskyi]